MNDEFVKYDSLKNKLRSIVELDRISTHEFVRMLADRGLTGTLHDLF